MDPITALLTTYLNASNALGKQAFEHMDLDLKVESVPYRGIQITFAHQQWQIRDASVCQTYRGDVTRLAQCTQAALDLFTQLCEALRAKTQTHLDQPSLERMYCTAATTYRPTQASVEWAKPVDAATQATQECRIARAALLVENTPETRQRRKLACEPAKTD